MVRPKPWTKFTVKDYMSTPEGKRYQLLDGEMILAPSPVTRHQRILMRLIWALKEFVDSSGTGEVFAAPYDVVLSDHDVTQPDILFVSNSRSGIVTEANIQGAPDLVVEILSPGTAMHDRGYKQSLYGSHGVREYWLVDPDAETVEVLVEEAQALLLHATHLRGESLTSPLLAGLVIDLEQVFGRD
ncbi:MAG: Uma2 family endonuclease [Chloroflexi bacterium]|nr:Uma2 family endonuclease [Chloroflexota bacterium]MCH8226312.1 Uma2 family endonuclease [Chloroflexota bacterium]